MNRSILIGRLTKDVELKHTQSNIPVAQFTLAVNRQFTKDDGEREADFIQCVAWRKTAELLSQYTHKGSLIAVEGRIQTRNYEDDNGQTRYITEIVCDSVQFLESKQEEKKTFYDEDEIKKRREKEHQEFLDSGASAEDLPF